MNGLKKALIKSKGWLIVVCFYTSALCANYGEPFNYYKPAPDRILENVEKYHLGQGIDKVKKRQFELAWSEFAFMLHYFPNHPKALKLIGELSIQMNDPDRAIRYFEKAVQLYPKEAQTFAVYGVFLHNAEKYAQAVEAYKQAIALNDKAIDYHYNLGLAYFAMKDYSNSYTQAQIAYNKGFPLPGLKEKLKSVKAWPSQSTSSS